MTSLDRGYHLIARPLLSEKTYDPEHGRYAFRVPKDANKVEISQAIERIFNVKVQSVNTLNVKGKWKIRGRSIARTQEWKKAMVTLAKGQTIDIL